MKRFTFICASALLLASTAKGAGIVSTVSSAADDVVVLVAANIEVSVSPYTYLPAGAVPADFALGTYSVNVSDSLLAVRVNREINPIISGLPNAVAFGQSTNKNDMTKTLNFKLTFPVGNPGTTSSDGWQVFNQGVTSLTNVPILTYLSQDIASGRYPLALDAAVYAF
ncbi:hypothetical protein [Serratia ureilytica]|uniref:hypothetical protein n=1 Tax=Serratia ureilytica TaxID=300181 RepID=UPI0034C65A67